MAMTMLQMSGVAPAPATMADGVLLIIDAQREYTDGLLPLAGVGPAVDALAVLLEKARVAGCPGHPRAPSDQGQGVQSVVDRL